MKYRTIMGILGLPIIWLGFYYWHDVDTPDNAFTFIRHYYKTLRDYIHLKNPHHSALFDRNPTTLDI